LALTRWYTKHTQNADRWLIRLFAVNDLTRVRHSRADHLYEVLS
jgi:hypothetical protein